MLIVLIEDHQDVHDIICQTLAPDGFRVLSAYTGLEGLEMVRRNDPVLVLIDVHLPDMEGWDICQQIRAVSSVAIIMISADDPDDEDAIRALNLGADEYFNKPLRPARFAAHVKALIRGRVRPPQESHITYMDNHLSINLYQKQVRVKGVPVKLSNLEYRLLELLVQNMNEPVPAEEIIEELWPGEAGQADSEKDHHNYVRIYINRVRAHIEPDQHKPLYITNDRGLGYRFNSLT